MANYFTKKGRLHTLLNNHNHNGVNSAAVKRVHTYQIEDLAAGADIVARPILAVPTGMSATLVSASIISQGAPAGIDDANTCVIVLTDGTNTIVTKTYNTGTAFPASGASGDLGTLDATHKILTAGEKLCLAVTNGATANTPAFMLQLVYTLSDAS